MISRRFYSTIESSSKVLATLKNPTLVKTDAYINGNWVTSASGETFKVTNPATFPKPESELATVQSMASEDFNSAIEAANIAFNSFKHTTGRHRSELLLKLYQLMIDNKEDLAKIVVLENGKPYVDALGEVSYAASFFQWFSEEAPRIYGDIIPSANGKTEY